jgi:hypothetical protein
MREDQVRWAVQYFNGELRNEQVTEIHAKPLVALAEAWLARKWPEKKEKHSPVPLSADDTFYNRGVAHGKVEGWNATIDTCRLASVVSEDTKKALAIQEAIRKVDVGSEVIIHNTDGSIYCILKKTAEEEER